QAGIDELESQTVKLLSLQPIGQGIFDAQVAFNLMDRYGPESQDRLSTAREALARDVAKYLKGRAPLPAVTLLQAPVFYSHGFMAYAEIRSADRLAESLAAAGLKFEAETEAAPTSVGVAGEPRPVLGRPEQDPNAERGWWFWGAADNLRVAAANAVAIAENLLGS
ncbi:MAG: Asd/ArgC dimerization domain-containing protein, partial [Candidatus Acidiferrales bacterium]